MRQVFAGVCAVAAGLLMTSTSFAQSTVELAKDQQALLKSSNPQLAANKKLVYDYWREVLQAGDLSKADQYMTVDFAEYNPDVPGTLKGFKDYFKNVFTSPKPVKPTIDNLVDIVAEGDRVVLVLRDKHDDPKKPGQKYFATWFELFLVTNGKVAAHWDPAKKSP